MDVENRHGRCAVGVETRVGGTSLRAGESRGQAGFTAVELAVALVIVALLASLAVPGFAGLRRSADMSSAANELVWALHLARSSARLQAQPTALCLTRDEKTCVPTPDVAGAGWLVFHPAGQAVATQTGVTGPLLHSFRLPKGVTVTGTRPTVTFWPVSRAGSTGTFDLCDFENRAPGRSIVVSQTGRPRVATEAASCAG
jgi:type IV fimbrial biogenesis protein FimT